MAFGEHWPSEPRCRVRLDGFLVADLVERLEHFVVRGCGLPASGSEDFRDSFGVDRDGILNACPD